MKPKNADSYAASHTATQLDLSANVLFLIAGVLAGVLGYLVARLRHARRREVCVQVVWHTALPGTESARA